MTKLIIVIDGVESTRYRYNLHTAHLYQDGCVSEDARIVAVDQFEDFINELKAKLIKMKLGNE